MGGYPPPKPPSGMRGGVTPPRGVPPPQKSKNLTTQKLIFEGVLESRGSTRLFPRPGNPFSLISIGFGIPGNTLVINVIVKFSPRRGEIFHFFWTF